MCRSVERGKIGRTVGKLLVIYIEARTGNLKEYCMEITMIACYNVHYDKKLY